MILFSVHFLSEIAWLGIKHTEIRLKMLGSSLIDCEQDKSIDNSETQFPPLLNEGDNDPEICMCAQL